MRDGFLKLVCVAALLAWGCLAARAEAEQLESAGRFKLGVILPLTGKHEVIGRAHRAAESMLRDTLEDLGDRVEIIYEDNRSTSAGALGAFSKLVDMDRVNAVYAVGADLLPLLAPFAEEKKIPFFSPETDISQANGRHYVTLFRNESGEFARALWEQIRVEKRRRIAVIKDDAPGINVLARALVDNTMGQDSVDVRSDALERSTVLRKQIEKFSREGFDMLVALSLPESSQALITALKGVSLPLAGSEYFIIPALDAGNTRELEGALMIAPFVPADFRLRLKEQLNSGSGAEYAIEFYEFLSLLHREVETRDGSFESADQFLAAMRYQGERRGLVGPIGVKTTAGKGVYFSLPLAVYRIVSGAVTVQRLFERPR